MVKKHTSKNAANISLNNENEIARLKTFYEEELLRRDKIIEELKQEREVLLKTALRQAEKNAKLSERLFGVVSKNKISSMPKNH